MMRYLFPDYRLLISIAATVSLAVVIGCAPAAKPQRFANSVLSISDTAPDFRLPAADGRQVSLADYAGKSSVLLYFNMADG